VRQWEENYLSKKINFHRSARHLQEVKRVVQQVCNVNAGVMSASYTSAVIIDQTLAPPKPTLQIQMTNGMVNLSWPQTYSNFTLQSAGNIGSGIWNSNLSAPSIQGSNLFITMPATNAAQFFRLSQ
jgi:hypothetical protein